MSVSVHEPGEDDGRTPVDHPGFQVWGWAMPRLHPRDATRVGDMDRGVAQQDTRLSQDVLSGVNSSDHFQSSVIGRDQKGAKMKGPTELQRDQALQLGWISALGLSPAILTPPLLGPDAGTWIRQSHSGRFKVYPGRGMLATSMSTGRGEIVVFAQSLLGLAVSLKYSESGNEWATGMKPVIHYQ